MQNKSAQNEFSDLNWINYIPNQWSLIRLNYILTESKLTSTTGSETLLAVSQYTDVTISERNIAHETHAASEFVGYKLVLQNDLVINIMLAWNGSLGVSKHNGIVSPSYCVYSFDEESHPQYYHYLLRSPVILSQFMRYSSGIVMSRLRLYPDDLHNVLVPKPPLSSQVIIAQYLNDFNSKLSYLSELRENQIALLEEYKRAAIQQAVTRGLDPDVPLKPSGVEWLGDIPAHWEVRRLKSVAELVMGQSPPSDHCSDAPIGLPFLQGCAEFGDSHPSPEQFCLVPPRVAFSGSILMSVRAPVGRLNVADQDYGIGRGLCGIIPNGVTLLNDFAYYQLLVMEDALRLVSTGSTYEAVSTGDVGGQVVVIPPLEEQAAIVAHLDKLTSDIDAAIAHTRREIELLEEYRTRLIADVVTGKLDVREAAADLPDVNLDDLQPLAEGGEADD